MSRVCWPVVDVAEPWLFVVDRNGRVSAAIEGGFGVDELEREVEKVVG